MSTLIIVIFSIIITLVLIFQSSKRSEINNNLKNGSLKPRFLNFTTFCEQHPDLDFQLAKDDGAYLEYRAAVYDDQQLKGYLHIGIHVIMGIRLYNHFISRKGIKINGYAHELAGDKNSPFLELSAEGYEVQFNKLMEGLVHTKEFKRYVVNEG